MKKRFDKTYKIISNKEICAGYFELKVKSGNETAQACSPGKFFMIGVPDVFLRRPLSIHDTKSGVISFLYKTAGKGTEILSKMKTGEISMLGPLGNGYPLESSNPVIVAGGTGIASVHYLAVSLKKKGTLYYGARSKKDLLCLDKFKKAGWKIIVSTEDGSKGYKGFITGILEKKLNSDDFIYVCGPSPMIKAVIKIAKEKNTGGCVSLEEKMACGVGNCQGCAVKIKGQNKMTCKDGPVFNIEDVEI
ncbi:MAG: dihydroorotate dehydrogenase electron transfer subunit [Endomicrobium sp.]|jgi:dihydroorotate dehydrogenase electron transfer subunit|nr:dihydroorotate dehydrogenase electron transfer subunit [Endomicrobium sp.]